MAWSDAARKAAIEVRRMHVRFSAMHGTKRISKSFNLKARDNYHAMDMIAKKIGQKKYDATTNRVFRFGAPKLHMSAKLARVVAGAGPEEG